MAFSHGTMSDLNIVILYTLCLYMLIHYLTCQNIIFIYLFYSITLAILILELILLFVYTKCEVSYAVIYLFFSYKLLVTDRHASSLI